MQVLNVERHLSSRVVYSVAKIDTNQLGSGFVWYRARNEHAGSAGPP